MAHYGGAHPFPRRFGGGRPRLKIIHDALCAARGSALDAANPDTIVWVECMAYARAICFDGYGTNDRLALQWDADRVTDMLGRWEKIFGIVPPPTATDHERRDELRKKWRRFLEASSIHSRLYTKLSTELGDVFGAIEYISVANAAINVPDATYPFGTVQAGYQWRSTVAHILILLVKPEGYTEGDFYAAAAKVRPAIDGMLPAWVAVDWYRKPSGGVPVTISGGPSQAGFYLDDAHNLDNNVLSA